MLKKLLICNYSERISWDEIFINKSETRERLFSGESFSDLPINDIIHTQSVLIPKSNNSRDNRFYSVLEKKNNEPYYQDYDDCTVYSRSAPNAIGSSYLANYINETSKNSDKSMPIIGNSPSLKSKGFSDYLDKSIGAFKNFFL